MAESKTPPSVGYETRDISAAPIVYIAALVIGIALLFAVAMWFLIRFSAERQAEHSPPANPLAAAYARKEPPEPRLQAHPLVDLAALRAHEKSILESYGWVDKNAGVVRVPIDRAKELLVERGLPAAGGQP